MQPAYAERAANDGSTSFDVEALTNGDLLAFLLNRGGATLLVAGGATAVARNLLDALGGLSGLSRAGVDELAALLPTAKRFVPAETARSVAAAFELGRRAATEPSSERLRLRDSRDVAAWGMARLGALEHEELWLLALDGQNRLRAARRVAQGGLHGVSLRAADPLRHALRAAASGFILIHNHPSGDPRPSPEDVAFTRAVAQAAVVVGMPLLDHVVVTRDAFESVPMPEIG
ncbi:DNA repair protein RadC [Labilithrix luteola]|uniref:DNA repair protein RadC n=1 Tax=Labilithrix luteola TaxID=1391654 RepID=A0A0K1QG90_9BACT|nr:JAB domain-containing protein [Labilithrix luteola]AKV04781.1 DNA repair protein RadC [Labilithrix luteola]